MKNFDLMVQGCTSDAGKSALVAGLCRVILRRGYRVAPFKPQNMALNSAVTVDGGEIGRAQAAQAAACGIEPTVHMNPVLLKPNTDVGAQVIVQGKALGNMEAQEYHEFKPKLLQRVLESYQQLGEQYQVRIIEGAGSPAEINLRDRDIANMGFAEAADCPVIIVADIDRGGVFAHLYGTYHLLSPSEQKRIQGFVINKFRGDPKLLDSGLTWLEQQTGVPVLGVIPYLQDLYLEAEDAIATVQQQGQFKVAVLGLPRISNHTDFDALRLNPALDVRYVRQGQAIGGVDLIIIPGSKSVRHDLAALKAQGWDQEIARHLRFGGKVIGICGGYQMLGQLICDPYGIEGEAGESQGLGYLPIQTELAREKQLKRSQGQLQLLGETVPVQGYEIHVGVSTLTELQAQPVLLESGSDGALDSQGQVFGSYLHGLFDQPKACELLLRWAGLQQAQAVDVKALQAQGIEQLADCLEANLDIERLLNRL